MSSQDKNLAARRDGRRPGSAHSLLTKRRAVTAWVLTGGQREAARAAGIGEALLRKWRGQAWFAEMEAEITADIGRKHRAAISRVYGRSLAALEDRLENGEVIVTKDGAERRQPVRARDLVIAADRLHSQLRLSDGLPTAIRGQAASLPQLAAQFAALAEAAEAPSAGGGRGKSVPVTIDVTPSRIVDGRPDVLADD